MSKADLTKQPDQVAAMFDDVGARYDRTNAILSAGNAALWRIATTRAVRPRAGERILDVAAGTGTSSVALTRTGAHVVAADFSAGMLDVGRQRHGDDPRIEFVAADATDLPFKTGEFDAVTISFGLRNVVDVPAALAEFLRVTRPGGRLVVCEFSTPPNPFLRRLYHAYLRYGVPVVARLVSSDAPAYEYLMESIHAWPGQARLAAMLRDAGYEEVGYRNLSAGIVALHRGRKPVQAAQAGAVRAAGRAKKEPAAVTA
ncbi:MAG TPA: class I SAM-dependent methyltransferase [Microbacteriaceae bacterium]|nr:class I SAM-dependent methyltransferase [Microbacteriaceae bacterium]